MSSFRLLRVRELLKRELGELIRRDFPPDVVGVITVNDVVVSNDLHAATVFIGFVGTDEQKKQGIARLRRERKHLQGLVARAVVLKYTPKLRFVHDESVTRGNRVLHILDEIERSNPPSDEPAEDPAEDR